ncbi:DUF1850 domain-containing protein [Halomicroarcula sp. GCM10025324]|uniref:DUF1850 domain-containing protein n=1 Tax=Haloarcula TaxID=2237 RepID=UPI0023E7B349|nr:DUF1850 domain-containing protein [Halomicroarcula sp. ZS-22-S1]
MRRRTVVLVVFVGLLVLGSAAAAMPGTVLVVADTDTGETYLTAPVSNGTSVGLEYMHSVEKTRVYDGYTVRGDELEMTRMEFESYGWGLPARENVTRENGTFVFDPPGQFERITVSPGDIAGHTLHVGDETYDLVALSDGNAVDIYVTHRSPLDTSTLGLIIHG